MNMRKIEVSISEKAYQKLRNQATVKLLMGGDHMTLSDAFLAKVLTAMEQDEGAVTIMAKEDK